MPTYTAEFHTDAEWALLDIKAATPEKALEKARAVDPDTLDFQSYGDRQPVNYITIRDKDCNDLAEWQDDQLRLEKSGADLLHCLEQILAVEDCVKQLPEAFLNHVRIIVARAKGGAA
jgi:hypothetical protein